MPKIVDAEARRQDVVEAVLRIIAGGGLERASLRETADEAGLAVGSVRHYFAGSEELLVFSFASVVDRIVRRLQASLPDVEAQVPGTPEHRAAVLTLLCGLLPLDGPRALEVCAWMAFKNAARVRPFLAAESDATCKRNAFVFLANCAMPKAVEFILQVFDQIPTMDELLQMSIIEVIRLDCKTDTSHRVSGAPRLSALAG